MARAEGNFGYRVAWERTTIEQRKQVARLRVLMVSDVYFPRINGVSTSIQTFWREFMALGIEVTLLAPDYPGQAMPSEAALIRIPSRGVPLDPEDRMMRRGPIDALLPQLAGERFDLVHIQTPFVAHYAGLKLARALGVPAIATYHTFFQEYLFHYFPFVPKDWMRWLARRFSRTQCNALDAIVVPSTPMRDALSEYGVTQPMHVLPTGLPEAAFTLGDGARFRAAHGIGAEQPVALFVGRVAFEKNLDFLLEVADLARRERPDLLLMIAGEGPALPALHARVRQLQLEGNVRFVGYLSRNRELLDCYRAADVFVFASRTETQGLVLLEAMAQAVPVLSTAVMGTRDVLLANGAPVPGVWVVEDAVAPFAAELVRVLAAPAERQAYASAAQATARTWHAPAMAKRLVGLYRAVSAKRGVVT